MLKDFTRSLEQYNPKLKKTPRKLIYKSFASLQNTTSLTESIQVYTDICFTFLSENESPQVHDATKRIEKLFNNIDDSDDDFNEEEQSKEQERDLWEEGNEKSTLRDASPFTNIFKEETSKVKKEIERTNQETEVFERKPLWSGIMLRHIHSEDGTFQTRDTNSPVENWFKFIKTDIGLKKKNSTSKVCNSPSESHLCSTFRVYVSGM